MKMLCIRGRLHRAHTGLYAGRVYDVTIVPTWCCEGPRAYAEGSVFLKPVRLLCRKCGAKQTYKGLVPWDPNRFIPFDPEKTIERLGRTATIKTRASRRKRHPAYGAQNDPADLSGEFDTSTDVSA